MNQFLFSEIDIAHYSCVLQIMILWDSRIFLTAPGAPTVIFCITLTLLCSGMKQQMAPKCFSIFSLQKKKKKKSKCCLLPSPPPFPLNFILYLLSMSGNADRNAILVKNYIFTICILELYIFSLIFSRSKDSKFYYVSNQLNCSSGQQFLEFDSYQEPVVVEQFGVSFL